MRDKESGEWEVYELHWFVEEQDDKTPGKFHIYEIVFIYLKIFLR